MKYPTLFSSPFVTLLLGHLARRGIDTAAMARRFGIEGESLPLDQVEGFFLAATAHEEPTFLLRLGLSLPRGAYGAVEFAWRTAPTLRAAGEVMQRYASFISAHFRPEVRAAEPGRVRLVWPTGFSLGRPVREFVLAAGVKLLRELTGDRITLWRIGFGLAEATNVAELERLLGAPVVWNEQDDWVEFDERELSAPTVTSDPVLFKVLCDLLDRLRSELERPRDLRAQVEAVVGRSLQEGDPTVGAVASALRLSPRTLQRRLGEERSSVRAIVDEVRQQRAAALLASDTPLDEVAWRLGFSQFSAFARAYKRWHGRPPGAARGLVARHRPTR
jgi:AraC-like DNA-binding protein